MYLQAQIAVFASEVNVVRHSKLWPRSMPGGTMTEADRRTLQEHAEVEERVADEKVTASFDDDRSGGKPADGAKQVERV
jgi:hypothetical protein